MTLNERLDELAQRGDGEITIGPNDGQDLEAFQATVSLLLDYERRGYLVIVNSHHESRTGRRFTDRVRVRLTSPLGVEWRKASKRDTP